MLTPVNPGTSSTPKRVGVLVVAYNAATTLAKVLDRLPTSFLDGVDHILIGDDASEDDTHAVATAYQRNSTLPLTVIRHAENLGYGGNQKAGYDWAIAHGLDVVVLLHGDGQYAPEVIEQLVDPLIAGGADAVFGSRMLGKGSARAGGMPAYKFIGNRILTTVQNALTGLDLSEWHSGYRAYRVDALADIDFASYSDGFDFDTEIILGLHAADKRIVEVPIPTYYGDEICYVNGMSYAVDVLRDVAHFRAHRMGFGGGGSPSDTAAYELKPGPHSSHGRLLEWLAQRSPGRVLDVGCSDGQFGALAKELGHTVVGVDLIKHDGVGERLDGFHEADLQQGLPEVGAELFDIVVAGDVLEHVTDPERLLREMTEQLRDGGTIFVSIPNFAHWYPRGRVALGRFDYDQRGPLDHGHVRFFTRRSFGALVTKAGLRVVERDTVGSPLDVIERGRPHSAVGSLARGVGALDRLATQAWPTLFGYQFLYQLERA